MPIRIFILIFSAFALICVFFAPDATADDRNAFQLAVDQFAAEKNLPAVRWNNIPPGESVQTSHGSANSATSMFFSPLDRTAYIGQDATQHLAETSHWLAPGIITAHEWGHMLWMQSGHLKPVQAAEDGADCIAGAWLSWYNDRAQLGLSVQDLPGLADLVRQISRNEYTPLGDIHGTFVDRSLALGNGFLGGIGACEYYKLFA